jgi:membrane protein YdbS with pleckstrin-like domain
MSEKNMHSKKGKNFKDVIEEEKNKGKTLKKIMGRIARIDSSIVYSVSFLLPFFTVDALIYLLLSPDVFTWAGLLVAVALVCSAFASRLTKSIKKRQWRYTSET